MNLCRLHLGEIFGQFTTLALSISLCQQKAFWGAAHRNCRVPFHHLCVTFASHALPFGPVGSLLQNYALVRTAYVRNCLGNFAFSNTHFSFLCFMNQILFGL